MTIGLGMGITVDEFNRRALIALRGIEFGSFNSAQRVMAEFQRQMAAGAVSDKMQQAVFNILHRFRRQVTDQAVKDFAANRAKGAD
jgi:hypothetical protein